MSMQLHSKSFATCRLMSSIKHRQFSFGAPLLLMGCLLVTWQCVAVMNLIPRYMFPAPTTVVKALYSDRASLTNALMVTLEDAVIGFVLATLIAGPLAILLQENKMANRAITPL